MVAVSLFVASILVSSAVGGTAGGAPRQLIRIKSMHPRLSISWFVLLLL
jgi:hypothetical protein